jgi:hypothetical protein
MKNTSLVCAALLVVGAALGYHDAVAMTSVPLKYVLHWNHITPVVGLIAALIVVAIVLQVISIISRMQETKTSYRPDRDVDYRVGYSSVR